MQGWKLSEDAYGNNVHRKVTIELDLTTAPVALAASDCGHDLKSEGAVRRKKSPHLALRCAASSRGITGTGVCWLAFIVPRAL